MRLWRKHPDLCVIGTLLAGLFVYQHGEAALAAVGPRLLAVKNTVGAQLAQFVDANGNSPADETTGNPATVGSNPQTLSGTSFEFSPSTISGDRAAVFGAPPEFRFLPICGDPGYSGCSR